MSAADDPFLWLEANDDKAVAWARAETARARAKAEAHPAFAAMKEREPKDDDQHANVTYVSFAGSNRLFSNRRDPEDGQWKICQADLSAFLAGAPEWRPVYDPDALGKVEGRKWARVSGVWGGIGGFSPNGKRLLLELNENGSDHIEIRELDLKTGQFAQDGFRLPRSQQEANWLDDDTLLIACGWEADCLGHSGFPFVLKTLKRGQPLAEAHEVYRAKYEDTGAGPLVLRNADGSVAGAFAERWMTPAREFHLLTPGGPILVPFPAKSRISGLFGNNLLLHLHEDWPQHKLKLGDLVSIDWKKLQAEPEKPHAELVFRPDERQAVREVSVTRDAVLFSIIDSGVPQVLAARRGKAKWKTNRPPGIDPLLSTYAFATHAGQQGFFLFQEGFAVPHTLLWAPSADGPPRTIAQNRHDFDSSRLTVERLEAVSADGTRVPYFLVMNRDLPRNGLNPVLQWAYGAAGYVFSPTYSGSMGRNWLEGGGVYVLAGVRGGGEYGPAWHSGAVRENWPRRMEDFIAVSEDLIARGITSPQKLCASGGSWGGMMVAAAIVKRPDLYRAAMIQIAPLDMLRFKEMGESKSSIAEIGDPDIPAERAVIERWSPYQNLRPGVTYPSIQLHYTSDDNRVPQSHARKFAARLLELGQDVELLEAPTGGHAMNSGEEWNWARLEHTFLVRTLVDPPAIKLQAGVTRARRSKIKRLEQ